MPKSIKDILGNKDNSLSESLKTELNEAFESRINEQRETVTAEIREEFAGRWETEKTQIVEAMDALLHDALKTELDEFAQDKAKVAEDRVKYKRAIKEHSQMMESFINDVLRTEIKELREDRNTQKANFGKLEEFVLKQLSNELNEFHDDKRSLAEQKVKMVREGKKVIAEARKMFIKKSAIKLETMIESVLRSELTSLREDIQTSKENDFGRKIFETFASEFMTSTLSENTQTAKLAKTIVGLRTTIAESDQKIKDQDRAINEAKRNTRIARDLNERKSIMSDMLGPLNKGQKELMGTLLESVKTTQLKQAYKKYLPSVISETPITQGKTKITESSRRREVNGDKIKTSNATDVSSSADIIELKKLAGLS